MNLQEQLAVLEPFEPHINESRELVNGNGIGPVQYLKLCIAIEPLPNTDTLAKSLSPLIEVMENGVTREFSFVEEHIEKVQVFLETLEHGINARNIRKAADKLWGLLSLLAQGDVYSKEIGLRISPPSAPDGYLTLHLLLHISKSCFSSPAARTAFLYRLSSNKSLASYAFAAAARTELEQGNILTASYMAQKSYSIKSSPLFISDLYYDIEKAAKNNGLDLHMGVCSDDLSEYFCKIPFEALTVANYNFKNNKARYRPCTCPAWSSVVFETSEAPWNSIPFQRMRESILDGSFRYCNKIFCPDIHNKRLPKKSDVKDSYLKDIIENKKTVLEKTKQLHFEYDFHCNLKCPSCRKDFKHLTQEQTEILNKFADQQLLPLLKEARGLNLSGYGEALSSPHSLYLLRKLSPETNPHLSIKVLSNAAAITPEKWESLGAAKELFERFHISIDGANKETFEKLRYPAKWENLQKSMNFLKELKLAEKISVLKVLMVVQTDNYKQISELLSLCMQWNVTTIWLKRIRNHTGMSPDIFSKTVDIHDVAHPMHDDFLKEINSFKQRYSELKNRKNEIVKEGLTVPEVLFMDF